MTRHDQHAIGLVLLSTLLYTQGYSLSKLLVERYGLAAIQLTFLRCALVLVLVLLACLLPTRSGID